MFSINSSWRRPGWKEVSRLPRYLVASPSFPRASSGRPKVAGQYGLGVLFFWSNTHKSTSIPSRVHGVHGMAWDGGDGTLATCTRSLLTRPASTHAQMLHMPRWAHTRSHKAGGDLFPFSPASKGPGNTR